jgi:hypothetical protein
MRLKNNEPSLLFMLCLGSTSVETDANGTGISDSWVRHYAYGGIRNGNPAVLMTDRTPSLRSGQASPAKSRTAPG